MEIKKYRRTSAVLIERRLSQLLMTLNKFSNKTKISQLGAKTFEKKMGVQKKKKKKEGREKKERKRAKFSKMGVALFEKKKGAQRKKGEGGRILTFISNEIKKTANNH